MSQFPNQLDDDLTVPPVNDNIQEVGAEAIQAIRSAIFAIEANLGINAQGNLGSVGQRLSVSIDANGLITNSAIVGLGLVALPVTNSEISPTAAIHESKLNLYHSTQFLYNLFINLQDAIDVLNDFVSTVGIEVLPHIAGTNYRHKLSHIDVDSGILTRVDINTGTVLPHDLTNSYTFASELSNDLLLHTRADGVANITTPPPNQAHNASGIYIDPGLFNVIPSTINNAQDFAEYVDSNGLVLLGSRTVTLFANGMPRSLRNSTLLNPTSGETLISGVPATTYTGAGIEYIIDINPVEDASVSQVVDNFFAQVVPGDYITVNYGNGTSPVRFTINSIERDFIPNTRTYKVGIAGINLFATSSATVSITRGLYRENRYNGLALVSGTPNNTSGLLSGDSFIIGQPAGAAVLGLGFDPSKLNQDHFNLYLALYPNGNPAVEIINLPAIDVTGNGGVTPGAYTLETVLEAVNRSFRDPSFNYRFIAYSHQGQFGIGLADRYNNASFSIRSDDTLTNNVVDNLNAIDPLGFGFANAKAASRSYSSTIGTVSISDILANPVVIFSPLRHNNYYVNGIERDTLAISVLQVRDGYGDGYWPAVLTTKTNIGGRIVATYVINLDLTTAGLAVGKTFVVQPIVPISDSGYHNYDYGRFIIGSIVFDTNCNCNPSGATTTITTYDAVHGTGGFPIIGVPNPSPNLPVKLYFGSDSVQTQPDIINVFPGNFHELFINDAGKSFTHPRAYFASGGETDPYSGLQLTNNPGSIFAPDATSLIDVSPKLRGFVFGQFRKITLVTTPVTGASNMADGYLCSYDTVNCTNLGPTVRIKSGEVARIYDVTGIDYIDFKLNFTNASSGTYTAGIGIFDIILYPSLQLNQEYFFVGTCPSVGTSIDTIKPHNKRQFGNTSEKQFSSSALDYISAPQRLISENGIIRGFDLVSDSTLTSDNKVSVRGGIGLVGGRFAEINDTVARIPVLWLNNPPANDTTRKTIRWYMCLNASNEIEWILSSDYLLEIASFGARAEYQAYVTNPRSPSTPAYPVRSTYFRKLIDDFKDVVPIYMITSTVDETIDGYVVTTADVKDLRRFTADGSHSLTHRFSFGTNASFRSTEALSTYINEWLNSSVNPFVLDSRVNTLEESNCNVYVRTKMDISGADFNFASKASFIADGGLLTITNSPVHLGDNVEFHNLSIQVATDFGFKITGSNVVFDKCDINYTYDAALDGYFEGSYMGNTAKGCIYLNTNDSLLRRNRNIQITNCKLNTTAAKHFPLITFVLDNQDISDDLYLDHYLEQIVISHNKITSTIPIVTLHTAIDDKRAVIVISSIATTEILGNHPFFPKTSPSIVGCRITNNICNKNQMILMSAATHDSTLSVDKVPTMLAPVDVSISGNVCGAICFLTRQETMRDYPNYNLDTNNPLQIDIGKVQDKPFSLKVDNNVCKYIFCGSNKGLINIVGSSSRIVNDITSGNNVYTNSMSVSGNTTHWIHIGVRNPTSYDFETPTVIVEDNSITAFDSSFLNDYHSVITPTNIGLIIDNVVGT